MTTLAAANVENLILLRLASPRKTPPTRSEIEKDLLPLAGARVPLAEFRDALARAVHALRASALITEKPLALTDEGRARVLELLRLDRAPSSRNWADFKQKYLPRLLLPDARETIDPLHAVLARALGVALPPKATLARVVDAWLAQKLELETRPFTLSSLRAELLGRELGVPFRDRRSLEETARIAAAKSANSAKADAQSLVAALTAEWLHQDARASRAVVSEPGLASTDSQGVASKVKSVLGRPELRRFGPHKIFIASLWDVLANDPEIHALGQHGFKQALVEAHRKGELELARADLVSAMDPADVAESEVLHLNAAYHFVHVTGDLA
jgi:hypothetical protein